MDICAYSIAFLVNGHIVPIERLYDSVYQVKNYMHIEPLDFITNIGLKTRVIQRPGPGPRPGGLDPK